jgi:drug/metabolite transporter (DMT)-like permease
LFVICHSPFIVGPMSSRLNFPRWTAAQVQGVFAAVTSAVVLGLPPVFAKQAIVAGAAPLTVVMLRTVLAMAVLWLAYLLFWRKYLYIYPVGLAGCLLAGLINGLGSLMFYTGLGHLDASPAQMIFMLYTIFLTLISRLDGYPVSRLTMFRLGIALAAVYLLTGGGVIRVNGSGALLVLLAGAMYALHVAVNQRVLYDVPAQTVAVYTLTAMSATVVAAYFLGGRPALPATPSVWRFVILLTTVTVLSRLALFMGVKYLGGVQAALLGLGETLVTLLAAMLLLGEKLSPVQWLGAALLSASMLLVTRDKSLGVLPPPKPWYQILASWSTRAPATEPRPAAARPRSTEPGD